VAEYHHNLGVALAELKRLDQALHAFREAIRLRVDYAEAHRNLAQALEELGRTDEVIASYRQLVRLKPDDSETWNTLGILLGRKGQADEAVACFREVVRIDPQRAGAWNNLGAALAEMGRPDDALERFQDAIRLAPDAPEPRKSHAMIRLLKGEYEEGFVEFEWRWRCQGFTPRPCPQPPWDGSSLAGKTILLSTEQGLGDAIQFVRFAPLVKRMGATVILECERNILPLLQTCPGIDHWLPKGTPPPDFDFYAPLVTLPRILRTTVANVPAEIPYLSADPSLVETWRRELSSYEGYKVGVVWKGNPDCGYDVRRSFPLVELEPLARVEGVQLFSLQKGHGVEQLCKATGRFRLIDLGSRLDTQGGAFVETAAVLMNLDLLVTCDTAAAHLAGALGRDVWIPLSYAPDWRWLLDREDSPWYPTVRLFRQTKLHDWGPVFARMANILGERAAQAKTGRSIPVAIAPGDLIDRITILRIKLQRISDAEKLRHARTEMEILSAAFDRYVAETEVVNVLMRELQSVNEELWEIEDEIRQCERERNFGLRFVQLARSVYQTNDRRALLKRRVNELLHAPFDDPKSYAHYQ
jgi:hypothetical protein